ncbi:tetratricopeptide repeat protein 36 isoform X3 [Anopheles darlingi]|uniref:tetratricopeptide repeat protein 36 isoform X3 n=1 Tax=Anopheles darlingi TaxID=43151 RepID=UPI002100348F|nr:tetratricopeptide repeat protein 36 isoform X3 [Anopheles darlingi]
MNRLKKEDLSERDRQVLESIFNPSQIGGEEYLLQDEEKHLTDPQDADDVDDPRVKESQRLEIEAIALTIAGKLSEALEMLGKSIETAPHRPAPWNNRAQVHCLLGQEINALKDVERALELSEGSGRTGCRALCQRGILRRGSADKTLLKILIFLFLKVFKPCGAAILTSPSMLPLHHPFHHQLHAS